MRSITLVLAAAVALMAAEDGTATGTFTVKGKVTKMAFAYATSMSNPMDSKKQAIRLILTDVALTPKTLADPSPFSLMDLTAAGKLHGVSAGISLADKSVFTTSLYDAGFKMSSVSVAGSNIKLEVNTLTATSISGRLYTEKADDFNDVPFEFNITFTAPISKK